METLKIMDYKGAVTDTNVDISPEGLEQIASIYIDVLTGDEIAIVCYKDGRVERFDSSYSRTMTFEDGGYLLYGKDEDGDINLLSAFNRRTSSYWNWWGDDDDEG